MMKQGRISLVGSAGLFVAMLLLLGCAGKSAKTQFLYSPVCEQYRLDELSITAPTTTERPKGNVYRLESVKAYPGYVVGIAAALGLSAPVTEQQDIDGEMELVVDDPAGRLSVNERSGKVEFQSLVAHETAGTPLLSSDAKMKAHEILKRLGLLPQAELTAYVGTTGSGTNLSDVVLTWNEMQMIESRDGQFIELGFNSDGLLLYMTYFWREPELVGDYRLISSEQARARIDRCETRLGGVVLSSDNIVDKELSELDLLYIPSPTLGGDFMIPAYVFHSDTNIGEWWTDWAAVPALPEDQLAITTPMGMPRE